MMISEHTRVALDTNVLVYAEGADDPVRNSAAQDLIDRLKEEWVVLPGQVVGELYRVFVKKMRLDGRDAQAKIMTWLDVYQVEPVTYSTLTSAMDLASRSGIQIFDAIILASAAEAGCRLLLSEDLQEGFTFGGVTVANPFAEKRNPVLEAILGLTH
jgi:predicted nucleic acid-binding protein